MLYGYVMLTRHVVYHGNTGPGADFPVESHRPVGRLPRVERLQAGEALSGYKMLILSMFGTGSINLHHELHCVFGPNVSNTCY